MSVHDPRADIHVDGDLVHTLLADQHPALAELPLVEVANGWDNVIFRLGEHLLVRVPRRRVAADLIEHEQRWLPVLAPRLPLPVPAPVAAGRPSERFPFAWSVCPWFEGRSAFDEPPSDLMGAADDLGAFVHALHVEAPPDAPANPFRGVHLAERAARFTERLGSVTQQFAIDAAGASAVWERALASPAWDRPPRWLHGDLHTSNLVTANGRLRAVIDFGDVTAGDPATDLAIAWMLFDAPSRARFREAVGCDDATWARAAGWAVALAVAYLDGSPAGSPMIPTGLRTLDAVVTDGTRGRRAEA